MQQCRAEVVAQGRRKATTTIVVECADGGVEGQISSVVSRPDMLVFDVIPMLQLVPLKVS